MVLLEVYHTHLTQRVVSTTCTDDLTTVVVNIVRREASWPFQRCGDAPFASPAGSVTFRCQMQHGARVLLGSGCPPFHSRRLGTWWLPSDCFEKLPAKTQGALDRKLRAFDESPAIGKPLRNRGSNNGTLRLAN